jgi:hypothetical protein
MRLHKHAQLHGQPLWAMGFWNAPSAQGVLSHRAVVKLRDTRTFYHMIPENLNAAEWIIWWLRALKTAGQKLATIAGGSSRLSDGLMDVLRAHPNVTPAGGHTLLGFHPTGPGERPLALDMRTKSGTAALAAQRLVLALPRLPLVKLAQHLPEHVAAQLDSVNGFPMLYIRNSIITYGLRDWARAPYGAANPGWQPGGRSWKVMDTFKAFDFGSGAKNVHIVGEACSDYQGFIEGALNSAELALRTIPARVDAEPETEG